MLLWSLAVQLIYGFFTITGKQYKTIPFKYRTMIEMCLGQIIGAGELSADPRKQRRTMLMKTFGAIAAMIVALINMFISGLV